MFDCFLVNSSFLTQKNDFFFILTHFFSHNRLRKIAFKCSLDCIIFLSLYYNVTRIHPLNVVDDDCRWISLEKNNTLVH